MTIVALTDEDLNDATGYCSHFEEYGDNSILNLIFKCHNMSINFLNYGPFWIFKYIEISMKVDNDGKFI